MSFSSERTQKTRKRRRCQSCGQHIEIGERYTQWAGTTGGDFSTADFHPDCREAEVEIGHVVDLDSDEWMSLRDHVSDGGLNVLHFAPATVRIRFGLPPEPEITYEAWLESARQIQDEIKIASVKLRCDFVTGYSPQQAVERYLTAREKARKNIETEQRRLNERLSQI